MKINPIAIIGKGGLTESVIENIDNALQAHELIKVSVLKNADCKASDMIEELAAALNATAVQSVGNKITLYRMSNKDNVEHIKLP